VLSGGGARGAYEVGVLAYLFKELPAKLGHLPSFDIYCGSSVGAVHACYLAGTADTPDEGIERLIQVWREMSFSTVYRFAFRDALSLSKALFGLSRRIPPDPSKQPSRIHGLLNTSPLEQLVVRRIPWRQLRRNVRRGVVPAVVVATTELATGRTVFFVETADRTVPSWTRDPHVVARASMIGPTHALASAAIPFLFPAVRIGTTYYCDGGLRLHSPISPALRLGADRVLIVGLARDRSQEHERRLTEVRLRRFMSAGFLFGKVLDAMLMDRIEHDLAHMRLLNEIFRMGTRAFGPEFLSRVNAVAERERGLGFRIVTDCFIRPTRDIGAIAGQHVRRVRRHPARSWIGALAFRALTRGSPDEEADLMSYLLFDGEYAEQLMELGMADARAQEETLLSFFSDEPSAAVAPTG
jgi:NTE family protein